MLDIKLIREKKDWVEAQLRRREPGITLDGIVELDEKRRSIQTETDEMRARQKSFNGEIAPAEEKKANPQMTFSRN
ncbi:MAG: hypothetical protein ACOX5R_15415 [bacterium]